MALALFIQFDTSNMIAKACSYFVGGSELVNNVCELL